MFDESVATLVTAEPNTQRLILDLGRVSMLCALGDHKWDLVFSPMLLWAIVYIILETSKREAE